MRKGLDRSAALGGWLRAGRGRHTGRRALPVAGLVAAALIGAILLVASVSAIVRGSGVPEEGAEAARQLAEPPVSATATPPAPDSAQVPVVDGRQLPVPTADPPTRLEIPAIGLSARVDPVGTTAETGEFDVPPSVDTVGWYRYGPGLETAAGSIVVAGHVDSADQGRGAFFRLSELAPGDRIVLAGASGEQREFEVVGREVHDKDEIPLARYFARDGEPRLTLITCGGGFDREAGRYQDNVVVSAVPVPA